MDTKEQTREPEEIGARRRALLRIVENASPYDLEKLTAVIAQPNRHLAEPARMTMAADSCGPQMLDLENIEAAFTYQKADRQQLEHFAIVREALIAAGKAMLRVVPPCMDRTLALERLRECRMWANSAISFHGRF